MRKSEILSELPKCDIETSEQMLLKKRRQQTSSAQDCHKPSIYLKKKMQFVKSLQSAIKQSTITWVCLDAILYNGLKHLRIWVSTRGEPGNHLLQIQRDKCIYMFKPAWEDRHRTAKSVERSGDRQREEGAGQHGIPFYLDCWNIFLQLACIPLLSVKRIFFFFFCFLGPLGIWKFPG